MKLAFRRTDREWEYVHFISIDQEDNSAARQNFIDRKYFGGHLKKFLGKYSCAGFFFFFFFFPTTERQTYL